MARMTLEVALMRCFVAGEAWHWLLLRSHHKRCLFYCFILTICIPKNRVMKVSIDFDVPSPCWEPFWKDPDKLCSYSTKQQATLQRAYVAKDSSQGFSFGVAVSPPICGNTKWRWKSKTSGLVSYNGPCRRDSSFSQSIDPMGFCCELF